MKQVNIVYKGFVKFCLKCYCFLGPKVVSITQESLAILSFKFTHNNRISAFTYNLYYANHIVF